MPWGKSRREGNNDDWNTIKREVSISPNTKVRACVVLRLFQTWDEYFRLRRVHMRFFDRMASTVVEASQVKSR